MINVDFKNTGSCPGVYVISVNGKHFVGKALNLRLQLNKLVKSLEDPKTDFQKAVKEFDAKIIHKEEFFPFDKTTINNILKEKSDFLIKKYNAIEDGYNELEIPKIKETEHVDQNIDKSQACSAIIYNQDGSFKTTVHCYRYSDLIKNISDYCGLHLTETDLKDTSFIDGRYFKFYAGFNTAQEQLQSNKDILIHTEDQYVQMDDVESTYCITRNPGIYCIRNIINNKVYIGQSLNLQYRIHDHIIRSKFEKFQHRGLYAAFKKYGNENFEAFVLYSFTEPDKKAAKKILDEKEKFYIKLYDSYKAGYNMTEGGDGSVGFKHKPETIEKIRKWTIEHNCIKNLEGHRSKGNRIGRGSEPKLTIWVYDLLTDEKFSILGYTNLRKEIGSRIGRELKSESFERALKEKHIYIKRFVLSLNEDELELIKESELKRLNDKQKEKLLKDERKRQKKERTPHSVSNKGYTKIKKEDFLASVESVLKTHTKTFFVDLCALCTNICEDTVNNYLRKWKDDVKDLKEKYGYIQVHMPGIKKY